jgi:hypothetical protein
MLDSGRTFGSGLSAFIKLAFIRIWLRADESALIKAAKVEVESNQNVL